MKTLRLHAKLYRAKAIDQAMKLAADSFGAQRLSRKRVGDYHEISLADVDASTSAELLAEIADAALELTVQQDRK